ncbi:hypothetical protein Tco_0019888 [Tanacetum coccineum]
MPDPSSMATTTLSFDILHPRLTLFTATLPSLTKPMYSASIILHFESTSGHDASAASTTKADPGKPDPNDSISLQQGKTKSAGDRLKTAHTVTCPNLETNKAEKEVSFGDDEFNTSPNLSSSDDVLKDIKMKDLSKLVQNVKVDFMDLDLPRDDEPIIIQDEEKEDDAEEVDTKKVHLEVPKETEDALEKLKTKAEAEVEVAFLSAQPSISYPTVEHLTKLLVKPLTHELSKLLTSHDFSNSLPTELKELLKAKIKTLDALPSLLNKVTTALDRFVKAIEDASQQVGDKSVPSAGQAGTHPAEGEKNTTQVAITQLFQRRIAEDAERENLNSQPITTTTPITTTIIPPTTLQLQSPFLSSPPNSFPQTEGELIKKHKGKKVMSSKNAEKRILEVILMKMLFEIKMKFVEQPIGPPPDPETADPDTIDKYYETVNLDQSIPRLQTGGRSISKLLSLEDEELLRHIGMPRLCNAK